MGFRKTKSRPPISTMMNSSLVQSNTSQLSSTSNSTSTFITLFFLLLITVCLCFFMYFTVVMLKIFYNSPNLRENARYILFVYMLLSDVVYLLFCYLMMLCVLNSLLIPMPACYVLYTVSTVAFRVTPSTLAAIALEKYVAICHPLRHKDLCTPQRANAAFTLICTMLSIENAIEFCYMSEFLTNIFNIDILCTVISLTVNDFHNLLRILALMLSFVSVAIIIFFTYIKITFVARKVGSQSSIASKARKTILLHAFQLLLCTASLLAPVTDYFPAAHGQFSTLLVFFVLSCVPRFISPLIYGIRDEHLRKFLKKFLKRDLEPWRKY